MEPYDLGLCRGLLHAGWAVSWYTCTESKKPYESEISFHPVFSGIWGKAHRFRRALNYMTGSLKAVAGATRNGERICHLHFFNGAPEELMLLLLCRIFGRKVVLTVHDAESLMGSTGLRSRLSNRLYRLANRLVVHNKFSRRELSRNLGVASQEIAVIPHGHYLHSLGIVPGRMAARNTLHLGQEAQVVLFFGQIKQVKGLDLLLQAVAEIVHTLPRVILVIAGRPWKADFKQYEEQILALGIAAFCQLHIRYIHDDEVATFYAAADLVVLPYRKIYQSGVLLLSMSYQRAVVASNLPGMTEIVEDGKNGFLFETNSAASLASVLQSALLSPARLAEVAESGYQYVQQRHSWELVGEQLGQIYMSLLHGPGPGRVG